MANIDGNQVTMHLRSDHELYGYIVHACSIDTGPGGGGGGGGRYS